MKTGPIAAALVLLMGAGQLMRADEQPGFDEATRQQATLERQQMADGRPHELSAAMAALRQTAETIEYHSGEYTLPGYLYKPRGQGPFPAVIWNHGSEKNPTGQPELAQFYTAHGFVFFLPLRHGHGKAPGPYIVDLQQRSREKEADEARAQEKDITLHEVYNLDVVAAVAWLRKQPAVNPGRMVMSGCSYGGIQTLLTAEKGLGIRAFIPFAPGAMSFANAALRKRLETAARHAQAPTFLLQAANDYSTGPSKLLGPILQERGGGSGAKLYPAFGATNQQGHGAFACWSLGITIWGNDVMDFIDAALQPPSSASPKKP